MHRVILHVPAFPTYGVFIFYIVVISEEVHEAYMFELWAYLHTCT